MKSLEQFSGKNGLTSALVTTIDKEGKLVHNNIDYTFVPAAMYAYVVGFNTSCRNRQRLDAALQVCKPSVIPCVKPPGKMNS